MIIAEDNSQDLMRKYEIPQFKASRSWIHRFIEGHQLRYRKPHYQRRGATDQEQVQIFFQELGDAIIKYGRHRVFNMDDHLSN